jgi:Ca-activated chloride channel family protein
MKRTYTAALLLVVLFVGASLWASPAPQETTFRSTSRTVAVYATVTDASGRLVPDLEQQHFEIFDNGRPQPLTVFKSDVQPITVVTMLDTSGSMTLNFELLKLAAERFVLRLLPEDRARIGSFSDKIMISPRFTGDRDELVRILRDDIQYGNPTFLWDAIARSMDALAGETGRRVVLVFSDGEDERSRENSYRDILTRAVVDDFMIYTIGLQSEIPAARRITRPDRRLRELAEQTGGGYFELTRAADLNTTFTRVADELHRQYVIGFSPEKLDGLTHKLEVRVKVPGMNVRARKSYLATDADTSKPLAPPDRQNQR